MSALPSPVWVRVAGLGAAGRLAPRAAGRASRLPPRFRAGGSHAVAFATVLGLGAGYLAGGVPVGVGAGAAAAVVAVLVRDAVRSRRIVRRRRGLLGALRLLVADLESGADPARALEAAADLCPDRPELARAARRARSGRDTAAVLQDSDDPHVRALGLAWRLGASAGAALAEVLARVAADLTDLDEQRRAVAVAVAGPRASAAMLAALPALGLVLGAAMGAQPLHFLLAVPGGRLVCGLGLLLDAAGLLWIRRILRRAAS